MPAEECNALSVRWKCNVTAAPSQDGVLVSIYSGKIESSQAVDGYSVTVKYTAGTEAFQQTKTTSIYSAFRSAAIALFFVLPNAVITSISVEPLKSSDINVGEQTTDPGDCVGPGCGSW